jgi:hypothetical protein
MATLQISSFPIDGFRRPGTTAKLKIWFSANFETAEGLAVLGGPIRSGSIYIEVDCTLNPTTHVLTVDSFSLPTTNDSSVRNVRASGLLYDASGAFVTYLFTNWVIPESLAPTCSFNALNLYNANAANQPPPANINDLIIQFVNAVEAARLLYYSAATLAFLAATSSAEQLLVLGLTPTLDEINKLDGAGEIVASGSEQPHIDNPTGGLSIDLEARAAIVSLIDAVEAFRMTATS